MNIFPIMTTTSADDWSGDAPCRFHPEGGMTKRELFAAMAMQGLFRTAHLEKWHPNLVVETAVAMADVLLAELEKPR